MLSGMSEGGFSNHVWLEFHMITLWIFFQKTGLSSCRKENMREKDVVDLFSLSITGSRVVSVEESSVG